MFTTVCSWEIPGVFVVQNRMSHHVSISTPEEKIQTTWSWVMHAPKPASPQASTLIPRVSRRWSSFARRRSKEEGWLPKSRNSSVRVYATVRMCVRKKEKVRVWTGLPTRRGNDGNNTVIYVLRKNLLVQVYVENENTSAVRELCSSQNVAENDRWWYCHSIMYKCHEAWVMDASTSNTDKYMQAVMTRVSGDLRSTTRVAYTEANASLT